MKQFIGMIEVLGEGGELQPLLWNPSHLVDGRAILLVDEPAARIWVWLGRGTTIVQRTTALRQARFIMRNGIHIKGRSVGTKCTEFVELPGSLETANAKPLKDLLESHPKSSEYFIIIDESEPLPTIDEAFLEKVETIEQTIIPEPLRPTTRARRRILSYEEQLSSKVLFAVSDLYGEAHMIPLGPNQFEVTSPRLRLQFHCQGDEIIFSLVQAIAIEDVEGFTRTFGQYPQLSSTGQQIVGDLSSVDKPIGTEVVTAEESDASTASKPVSVTEKMRAELSKLGAASNSTKQKTENKKENEVQEEKEPEDSNEDSDEFDLFT